jgi:BASS family bile acid:Na+ symporter
LVKGILDLGVLFVIILMMAAVGLELEGHHFRAVLQRKRLLLLSLASQTLLLPALGFGLTHALALPPRISAGMLLIAACPVGDIANFYTLLARANLALSVTLNALTILIAPATMALVFETYDHVIGVPFEFALGHPAILLRPDADAGAAVACRHGRPPSPAESAALYGRTLRRIVALGIVYLLTTTMATQ